MIRVLLAALVLGAAAPSVAEAAPGGTSASSSARSKSSPKKSKKSEGSDNAGRSGGKSEAPERRAPAPYGDDRGPSGGSGGDPKPDNGGSGDAPRGEQGASRPSSGGGSPERSEGSAPSSNRPDERPPREQDPSGRELGAERPDRADGGRGPTPGEGSPSARPTPAEGPRPLDTRAPAMRGDQPRPGLEPARRAPPNLRGPAAQARHVPGAPRATHAPTPGERRAAEVARSHRSHARSHHHHGRPHGAQRARHIEARHWRDNWVRHHHPRPVWWRPVTWYRPWYPGRPHLWYHGVFVYGPGPGGGGGGGGDVAEAPKRAQNHEGDFAIGVRGGSYLSGYTNGARYGDFGLGLAARYRVVEPLGFELQWNMHQENWGDATEREESPLSASVQLFAFPWTRFNPYLTAGLTLTGRDVNDDIGNAAPVESRQAFFGPHAGLGLELGVSQKVSVNADVRWIGYVNREQGEQALPGAGQANLGLNFYF